MTCLENNKTIAHDSIRDEWALGLQRIIAKAGYILPNTKLDTKKPHLLECNLLTHPLDLYFEINPNPSPETPALCEYLCVGGNVTITSPVKALTYSPENVI